MPPLKARVEIRGVREIERELQRLAEELRRRVIREALTAAAQPVREEWARGAPRSAQPRRPDIGHYADSIIVGQARVTRDAGSVNVGPDRDHYWGLFLEYGTENAAAQPHARPAFDATGQEALGVIVEDLQDFFR